MAFIPKWDFVDDVVFRRKRNGGEDYQFDLFAIDDAGTRAPLDCTGIDVRFKARGPMPKASPLGVDPTALPIVINGLSVSRTGTASDGKRAYTPGSGELDLYGIYLVEVWLESGGKAEKIPKGMAYWKIESG